MLNNFEYKFLRMSDFPHEIYHFNNDHGLPENILLSEINDDTELYKALEKIDYIFVDEACENIKWWVKSNNQYYYLITDFKTRLQYEDIRNIGQYKEELDKFIAQLIINERGNELTTHLSKLKKLLNPVIEEIFFNKTFPSDKLSRIFSQLNIKTF